MEQVVPGTRHAIPFPIPISTITTNIGYEIYKVILAINRKHCTTKKHENFDIFKQNILFNMNKAMKVNYC